MLCCAVLYLDCTHTARSGPHGIADTSLQPFVSLAQWKKVRRRDAIAMANDTPISRNAMIDERLKDVEESIMY